ncbi:MAG: hypothetical protein AAF802_24215, partial [Planctomycetota bacterium]
AVGEATLTLCKLLMAKSADDRPPSAEDVVAYIDRFGFGVVVSKPNAAAQPSLPAGESTRETVAAGPNSTMNDSSIVRLRIDEKQSVSRTASAIQIDVKDRMPTTKTSDSVAAKTRKRRKTSSHLWILSLSGVAFIASLACLSFLLTQQPSEQPASGAQDASEKTAATRVYEKTLVSADDPNGFYYVDGRNTLHRGDCRIIRDKVNLIEVQNPDQTSLEPCRVCNPLD